MHLLDSTTCSVEILGHTSRFKMDASQVDALVLWVCKMSERYYSMEGEGIFDQATLSKISGGIGITSIIQ